MKTHVAVSLFFCALLCAPAAFAGGAGGVGYGYQVFDGQFSSSDMGMSYMTGYGYGVREDGSRVGGFGSSFVSASGDAAGGYGGMLVGHEWRTGPFEAALTLWGGLGGASWQGRGFFIGYGSAEAEIGMSVLPWMQVVFYAGYQALGNILPGSVFGRALLTTPVVGFRIGWGGFEPSRRSFDD
jgi:hypothetical protein